MNKYIIHGGRPLFGEVTISGAKNAAVAIIPAALLVDGVCRIENIPQISDVTLFFSILEELGAHIRVLNRHAVEIDCHAIHSTRPSYDLARRIRASYYLLGALLGFCLAYGIERKYIRFETKAVWWAQILKVVLGLAVVLAVKEGLKLVFSALGFTWLGTNAIRYFAVVLMAATVWPLTFRFFARLGKKTQ